MRALFALLLCTAVAACGAGASRATAAPKKKAPAKAAEKPVRAPRPLAIGAATADRVKKTWEVAAGGYARAVAVSSRLGKVAFANKEGVELYELATGKAIAKVGRCKDVVRGGLAFHAGELVIVCETAVQRLDAQKRSERPELVVNASRITAAAFTGSRLVLGHHDGVIRIYGLDGSAGVEVKVPGPPIDAKSVALSADGGRLAVAWVQGSVWWWEVQKPEAPHDLVRNDKESDALSFSDDGALLAEEGAKNTTTLWSLGDPPSAKAKLKNGSWVKRILFTPDGKWLARAGSDGLELAEILGPRRVALDTRDPVEDAAFDEQRAVLVAADRQGRLTAWAVR